MRFSRNVATRQNDPPRQSAGRAGLPNGLLGRDSNDRRMATKAQRTERRRERARAEQVARPLPAAAAVRGGLADPPGTRPILGALAIVLLTIGAYSYLFYAR